MNPAARHRRYRPSLLSSGPARPPLTLTQFLAVVAQAELSCSDLHSFTEKVSNTRPSIMQIAVHLN